MAPAAAGNYLVTGGADFQVRDAPSGLASQCLSGTQHGWW